MLRRTVAVVDLVGYSSIAKILEENISAFSVSDFNRQIQSFIDRSLARLSEPEKHCVLSRTGDGIIVLFENPEDAHTFGAHVHLFAKEHTDGRSISTAERWFRVGIATGDVIASICSGSSPEYAGTTIANAVRLESAAHPGEILIDLASYSALSLNTQRLYGREQIVKGKREERFHVRRLRVTTKSKATRLSASPVLTRRAWIAAAATLCAGGTLAAWFERFPLELMLHPLPPKRFVVLMAWPRAREERAPTIAGVIETIAARLSRAEQSIHDLLIIPADQPTGDPLADLHNSQNHTPQDVADSWSANLILAARILESGSAPMLELQILDRTAEKLYRRLSIPIGNSPSDLNTRASETAARLLDLPVHEPDPSDEAALASLPLKTRQDFDKGKYLSSDPNNARFEEAKKAFEDVSNQVPDFALPYAELARLYLRQFDRKKDPAMLRLADMNVLAAISRNPHSQRVQIVQAIETARVMVKGNNGTSKIYIGISSTGELNHYVQPGDLIMWRVPDDSAAQKVMMSAPPMSTPPAPTPCTNASDPASNGTCTIADQSATFPTTVLDYSYICSQGTDCTDPTIHVVPSDIGLMPFKVRSRKVHRR